MKTKNIIFIAICILSNINAYNAFSSDNEKQIQLRIPLYNNGITFQTNEQYINEYPILQYFTSADNPFTYTHNLDFYKDFTDQLISSARRLNDNVFVHGIYSDNPNVAASIKQMLFSILRNIQNAVQNLLFENQNGNQNYYNELRAFHNKLITEIAHSIFTSDYIDNNL